MHVLKANFNGTPNVGLYGYATDKVLLLGEHLPEKLLADIRAALGGVEVHPCRIAGTTMPGLFLAGNSRTIIVPNIAFDSELAHLRKLGIPHRVVETLHTCFGNTVACNDHGAIISTEYTEAEQRKISEALGVPAVRLDIAGTKAPGACIVLHGSKGIVHRDATDEEVAVIEKTLQVTLAPATVNLGTPYLRAAIIHNGHGFVIGDASGGPEIVHIDEALYAD